MSLVAERARASLTSFGTALLPEEYGGPPAPELADRVERYLRRLPTASRVAMRAGLLTLAAASYVTTGRSLSRLGPDRREQVLRRVAALSPDVGAAVEAMKAIVLLANGAETYAPELLSHAMKQETARPDAVLNLVSSADHRSVVTADAVIVGSGAGGAMVARSLARAGLDVVVLEEGRRWTVEEFRTTHPIDRYAGLYRGAGATVALGRPSVVLPIGRAVGGTTVVNSGTCYRPPPAVQRRWRDEFGLALADPDRLAERLDDVERTLRVAPVPLEVMGHNGRPAAGRRRGAGLGRGAHSAQRAGLRRLLPVRDRLPPQCEVRRAPQRAAPGVRGGRTDHLARSRRTRAAPRRARARGAPDACRWRRWTSLPTRSSWRPVPPRRRGCCGAAALALIRGSGATWHCIRRRCSPGASRTMSSPWHGVLQSAARTSFTNHMACSSKRLPPRRGCARWCFRATAPSCS